MGGVMRKIAALMALLAGAVVVAIHNPYVAPRYQQLAGAVQEMRVGTDGGGWQGSGVHLGDGWILTAQHIFGDPLAIEWVRWGDHSCDLPSIGLGDPSVDVGWIRCEDASGEPLIPLCGDTGLIGEEGYTFIGYPKGLLVIAHGDLASRIADRPAYTFGLERGASGGAVVVEGNAGWCVVDLITMLWKSGEMTFVLGVGNEAMGGDWGRRGVTKPRPQR